MITRRRFLAGAASSTVLLGCRPSGSDKRTAVPAVTPPPLVTHGVQSGDVQGDRAVVWARCSEPARMLVEWSTTPSGTWNAVAGPVVTPESDLTGTVALGNLPPGQRITYRVTFEREAARGRSAVATGSFATPGDRTLRILWTGDTCGQGYGRNPEWGGLLGYKALRTAQPDVFVHSGDMIYADNPIKAEMTLADGRVWKNITNERVSRVCQELDDFRARFLYNLEDEHVRALLAEVPVIAQWDDHETHNNWWPGQQLKDERYSVRDSSTLAARSKRAFFEYNAIARPAGPIQRVMHLGPLVDVVVLDARSFRTPNDANTGDGSMFGAVQTAWLVEALATSKARFKIVACDQPISTVIPDEDRQEGFANGLPGPPTGREKEVAGVLAELARRAVKNVVWITADVHYAAAHQFEPARASFPMLPFWEFVAGPIHAGTFGPNALDPSLGGEVKFEWAPPPGAGNLAPWDGLQTFGTLDVMRDAIRVGIWGIDGKQRFGVELPYEA